MQQISKNCQNTKNFSNNTSIQLSQQQNKDQYDSVLVCKDIEQLKNSDFQFDYITNYPYEQNARVVCVDGKRGSGKTYLANGLIDTNLVEDQQERISSFGVYLKSNQKVIEDVILAIIRCKGEPLNNTQQLLALQQEYQQAEKYEKVGVEKKYNKISKVMRDDLENKFSEINNNFYQSERFVTQFAQKINDIIIHVVNEYQREEQLQHQDNLLKLQDHQEIYIIHNYKDAKYCTVEAVKKQMQADMSLIPHKVQGITKTNYGIEVYQEIITSKDNKRDLKVFHLMLGFQGSQEVRQKINQVTFDYLKTKVKDSINDNRREIDLGELYQDFLNEKMEEENSYLKESLVSAYEKSKEGKYQHLSKYQNLKFQVKQNSKVKKEDLPQEIQHLCNKESVDVCTYQLGDSKCKSVQSNQSTDNGSNQEDTQVTYQESVKTNINYEDESLVEYISNNQQCVKQKNGDTENKNDNSEKQEGEQMQEQLISIDIDEQNG